MNATNKSAVIKLGIEVFQICEMINMDQYNDIIDLPHHISKKHKPLGRDSYAAQFSPFAALTGYDGIVSEAARTTDERTEMSETELDVLSAKIQFITKHIKEKPEITFTYFKKDEKKPGGSYLTKTGNIKQIDDVERLLHFTDGTKLPIDDVVDMKSVIFDEFERELFI